MIEMKEKVEDLSKFLEKDYPGSFELASFMLKGHLNKDKIRK